MDEVVEGELQEQQKTLNEFDSHFYTMEEDLPEEMV